MTRRKPRPSNGACARHRHGLVAGRDDAGAFDHQDDRPARCSRPMLNTLGDRYPLPFGKLDGPSPFEIDDELAVHDVEELVLVGVLMPDVLALDDPEPDDTVVHARERLVVPGPLVGIDQRLKFGPLERTE